MTNQRAALSAFDALLGFEKVIEATWFFTERIEPAALRASLSRLASHYPLLAGHVGRRPGHHRSPLHGWEIRSLTTDIPLGVRTDASTSRAAALTTDAARFHSASDVSATCWSGAAVMAGRSQVMAAALTNFGGGGSAVGVRLSHAVADASGFYRIVGEWSRLHKGGDDLGGDLGGGDNLTGGADLAGAADADIGGEPPSGSPLLELRRDCVESAHRRVITGAAAQESLLNLSLTSANLSLCVPSGDGRRTHRCTRTRMCGRYYIRLQPPLPTVTASITYGYSLHYLRRAGLPRAIPGPDG